MIVNVVGIPGDHPQLPELLDQADLVVGALPHLAAVPNDVPVVELGPVEDALEAIEKLRLDEVAMTIAAEKMPRTEAEPTEVISTGKGQAQVVVLASGDPTFFGVVRALSDRFGRSSVRVWPAASTLSQMFGQLGMSWDDAIVINANGGGPEGSRRALNACLAYPKVAVISTDGDLPGRIGGGLKHRDRMMAVASGVGTPDEQVVELSPAAAGAQRFAPTTVTVVWRPVGLGVAPVAGVHVAAGAPRTPHIWGLADEEFAHEDATITPAEVRAIALGRLGPGPGDLVWDIGSGEGSVAVECGRFGAAVLAVEPDRAACVRIETNASAHSVEVDIVTGRAPAALAELPDPDAVFVGGGGPEVVAACAARARRCVVVAVSTVDQVTACRAALTSAGLAVDGVLQQASGLAGLGSGERLATARPTFLLWGERS
ncbi:bifunctional cobalt-precorrin-7 (C(5))-methyltransferase/cobalt-precorrin-6B (C(15))-methyltransferase [Fodinicola acaciae]|uniref:bifunctional cobalt-precorrin-7 (C(5))-methyltransferase/cobalt-precorrin-6B (C(15))-methyltransferase n=1 Tax=Fodinicola acaciae TaxID=2681555 RepID=UPI001C9E4D69|nr:bifunctional cobalt-precorrin-7 (C(5))-methyltransferase CbiE/decarboxylating cobalt-precorrin-6B (C(15))-methyltransferase CbiT [Fodinicola acaciae]